MCDGPSLNDDPRRARTADRQRVIVVDAVRAARAGSAFGVARLSRPVGSHSVMPPTTAILLESVPPHRGGVASGVFNTSRQVGGALAVAVFGLLWDSEGYPTGVVVSLLTASTTALLTAAVAMLLRTHGHGLEAGT